MNRLEVHAHLRVQPGQLDGFKRQASELIRITREQDTKTLRYDWFITEDGAECEVHEAYVSEDGFFEHNAHVLEARTILFRDFAFDHRMTVFGDVSQRLRDLTVRHAGGITVYTFLEGLRETATV